MENKKQFNKSALGNFGGVALADILANSVAVMIILFIITLNIKEKQEEERQEKIEDISILMSRKIARSAVLNALPTSKPARLHDYDTSPIDKNVKHNIMPILEFHSDFIRNYYSNEKYYYKDLLLKNNAFDRYLLTLNSHQKLAIRIDIYSIKLYYIAMSILKEHKIDIRHWHFLGYKDYQEKIEKIEDIFEEEITEKTQEQKETTPDDEEVTPQLPDGGLLSVVPNSDQYSVDGIEKLLTEIQSGQLDPNQLDSLKFDIHTLEAMIGFLEEYILKQLQLPNSQNEQASEENNSAPNGFSQNQEQQKEDDPSASQKQLSIEKIDKLNNLLKKLKELSENLKNQDNQNSDQKNPPGQFSISLPNQKQSLMPQSSSNNQTLDEKMLFSELFFIIIFDYLQALQNAYDTNKIKNINLTEIFILLENAIQNQNTIFKSPHAPTAQIIAKNLKLIENPYDGIGLYQEYSDELPPNSLLIEKNTALDTVTIFINENQNRFDKTTYDYGNKLFITLYQFPVLHEGEEVMINDKDILMIPQSQIQKNQFRWRSIMLFNRQKRDFKIGYLFAKIEDNHIITANDPIQMKINDQAVVSIINPATNNYEIFTFLFYTFILGVSSLILFQLIRNK